MQVPLERERRINGKEGWRMVDPVKGGKFCGSVMLVASWYIYDTSFGERTKES